MLLNKEWDKVLKDEFTKDYFVKLKDDIRKEYNSKTIFPCADEVFKAFRLTDYDKVKVVILGQDPYHGEHEAEGLSFSVKKGVKFPPSLLNIFKELKNDLGYDIPKSGSLEKWGREGVLLLNSILTVEKDRPLSHKGKGWEIFTDQVIRKINEKTEPVVFILWGSFARSKKEFITNKNHYIIESVHPSPLSASRGFFGTKPFSRTNKFLESKNISPVDFKLD